LWGAVLGTQFVATLIAVYGLFMTPLGWGWALFVWLYALAWFLLNDRLKLLAYKIFDPVKAAPVTQAKVESKSPDKGKSTPAAKPASVADSKAELNPEAAAAPAPETKPEPVTAAEPGAEPSPDLTPQIAKRAYEIYQERLAKGASANQDWEQAEREIRKAEATK
jgi:H+-transporting ATPase